MTQYLVPTQLVGLGLAVCVSVALVASGLLAAGLVLVAFFLGLLALVVR